jgi:hypothetical protein
LCPSGALLIGILSAAPPAPLTRTHTRTRAHTRRGPLNIRCNAIAYGLIDTRLTRAKEGGESISVGGRQVGGRACVRACVCVCVRVLCARV